MKTRLLLTGLFALGAVVVPLGAGQTPATASATISNTGPGSTNSIGYWTRYKSRMSAYGDHTTAWEHDHNYGGCDYQCDDHDHDYRHKIRPRLRRYLSGHSYGSKLNVKNDTKVDLNNSTHQSAHSGDAKVKYNTDAGDAATGDAHNQNDTDVTVEVENNNDGYDNCGCEGGEVNGVIDTTGPHSHNVIGTSGHGGTSYKVVNDTDVDLNNKTKQTAHTGDAVVAYNTYAGDATSGDATNHNQTNADVSVENNNELNGDCGCYGGGEAVIHLTGPGSYNSIYGGSYGGGYNYNVSNDTNVDLNNNTSQYASSGNAYVVGNTSGGSATSGNASNTNSTSFNVNVSNNN